MALITYVDAKYRYFQHFQKASCKFDIYIQLTLPIRHKLTGHTCTCISQACPYKLVFSHTVWRYFPRSFTFNWSFTMQVAHMGMIIKPNEGDEWLQTTIGPGPTIRYNFLLKSKYVSEIFYLLFQVLDWEDIKIYFKYTTTLHPCI